MDSIKYSRGELKILDQLLLPDEETYVDIWNVNDGWSAIKKMKVRGAPAIAMVGILSLAVELQNSDFKSELEIQEFIKERLSYLITARPTAVNMADAAQSIEQFVNIKLPLNSSVDDFKFCIIEKIEDMLENDIDDNRNIGRFGASHIKEMSQGEPVNILTHCNTGSLATSAYGTALGVVRNLHSSGSLNCCYFTETRPYNQGSRLTAYELLRDRIPHCLICDSMVGALMKSGSLSAVIVGADRVVKNGDVANKIGTYQLSVLAYHHKIPFYVCATLSSIDFGLENGSQIKIEERNRSEMISIKGVNLAPKDVICWNPAFDVTPAGLITGGIVTEVGVISPNKLEQELYSLKNLRS